MSSTRNPEDIIQSLRAFRRSNSYGDDFDDFEDCFDNFWKQNCLILDVFSLLFVGNGLVPCLIGCLPSWWFVPKVPGTVAGRPKAIGYMYISATALCAGSVSRLRSISLDPRILGSSVLGSGLGSGLWARALGSGPRLWALGQGSGIGLGV